MLSERHVRGRSSASSSSRCGRSSSEALRDGDRFFYLNDPYLREIERLFGISYKRTLGQIIEQNAGIDVQDNVFVAVAD